MEPKAICGTRPSSSVSMVRCPCSSMPLNCCLMISLPGCPTKVTSAWRVNSPPAKQGQSVTLLSEKSHSHLPRLTVGIGSHLLYRCFSLVSRNRAGDVKERAGPSSQPSSVTHKKQKPFPIRKPASEMGGLRICAGRSRVSGFVLSTGWVNLNELLKPSEPPFPDDERCTTSILRKLDKYVKKCSAKHQGL